MIAIGGIQTGIQCIAAPSGWNILGRTPVRTYHPHRDPIFLIEPGDHVTFFPVPASEWDALDRAGEAGELVAEIGRRMSLLVVDKVGPATSVQDSGRSGAQRYGLTSSGAMDLQVARHRQCPGAPDPRARPRSRSARSGRPSGRWGEACASRSRGPIAPRRSAGGPPGSTRPCSSPKARPSHVGAARSGVFSYLGIEGGIAGEPVYGSLSVSARAGLGSPYPRPLQARRPARGRHGTRRSVRAPLQALADRAWSRSGSCSGRRTTP